jgi:hypothetical protein
MIIVFQQLLLLLEHLILGVLNGSMGLQIGVLLVVAVFGPYQRVSEELILNSGVLVEMDMECVQPLDANTMLALKEDFIMQKC